MRLIVLTTWACLAVACGTSRAEGLWLAGAAKENITPRRYMWMSGYASRDQPADGKITDLWAKALAIESPAGERAVLVTVDLVGIPAEITAKVQEHAASAGIVSTPSQLVICCSHTHTGPVIRDNLAAMYFLDEDQVRRIKEYHEQLLASLARVVDEAWRRREPARLAWGVGTCDLAVNRRNNKEADVVQLRAEGRLAGPVDHEVPVLTARNEKGDLTAVVFGYACHATVLSLNQWSGDYPGFAQIELEKVHPAAVALFFAGCGGDQNPLPRRTVELARTYGRQLAQSVEATLAGTMQAVDGRITTIATFVEAPFAALPSRDDLVRDTASSDRYVVQRARMLLEQVDAGKPLPPTYPYPIEVWEFGQGLTWVFLGGEVVVDYSLRLKSELGAGRTWVAAYTNDVMAYIPSRRVLAEGGYEGGGAMVYYGQPTVWAPEIEELIVKEVVRLAEGP
jgi:hypothetical protein